MTNPDDPAFPFPPTNGYGLTKREWFIGMAIQGVVVWDALVHEHRIEKAGDAKNVAKGCIELVDALIAELNKKP